MNTLDPVYLKSLLPVVTIKNTANNTTLYSYNSFTDAGTTDKVLYVSVNLSQNTHGEFVVQFEDQDKTLESTITVGSRVQIDCGKVSTQLTRLISALVRKKGYSRGANNKVLYTIQGSSTGIRLNERVLYVVSEAAKLGTGQIDINDASRKADTLLANSLNTLTADGILSISNLAANSDVETFIPSIAIEYGELQDVANYIEDQSGGEVVVDTNDLVNFRYEIKNNLFGRGFTIKNSRANAANDDADDTMYLVNKNWTYEDDFYKSASYANRVYAILSSETVPSDIMELGFNAAAEDDNLDQTNIREWAYKIRPTHSHFIPGDIIMVGAQYVTSGTNVPPWITRLRIAGPDDGIGSAGNTNNLDIWITIDFLNPGFSDLLPVFAIGTNPIDTYRVMQEQIFYGDFGQRVDSFDLDTTKDYWFIFTNDNFTSANGVFSIARQSTVSTNSYASNTHTSGYSTFSSSGTNWSTPPIQSDNLSTIFLPRRRSISMAMWDPKAIQAISSGITQGQYIDSTLSDAASQIKTKEAMYRYLSQQLYNMARPRTSYNFPSVLAPNIPIFPGDPIIISDDILGFSTSGKQIALTTCGDMTYSWGAMDRGEYTAPTQLSINAIGIHPRYR